MSDMRVTGGLTTSLLCEMLQLGETRHQGAAGEGKLTRYLALVFGLIGVLWAVGPALAEAPSLNGEPLPDYAAPEGGMIQAIRARGSLVNGVEAQNPPFEFIENGEIVGFDIDLSRAFAESVGVKLEVIDTAWSGVIPSLYSQKFDMIWSAMTITEPRKKAVTFSKPYASDQVEFIVRKGDTAIKSIEDLNSKKVATQLNSAAEFQLKEIAKSKNLTIDIRSFDSFPAAYLDLANGNVDAATSTQLNNRELFKKQPDVYEVALKLPIYNFVGVATRQQDTDLSKAIDEFIAAMKASGKLGELQTKWFGYAMDLPD